MLVLDSELRVVTANRSFCRMFRIEPADVERHPLDRIIGGRLNQPSLRAVIEKVLVEEPSSKDIELNLDGEKAGRWVANARRFQPTQDRAPLVLIALEKIAGHVH